MSGAICQIPWLEQKNDLDNAKAVFRNYKERFKFAKMSSDPMGIDQKICNSQKLSSSLSTARIKSKYSASNYPKILSAKNYSRNFLFARAGVMAVKR